MDKLRKAWRHHRIRLGRIRDVSALEIGEALDALGDPPGHLTTRDVARIGYFHILAAAGFAILERERLGELGDEDPLPLLLVASGAVS